MGMDINQSGHSDKEGQTSQSGQSDKWMRTDTSTDGHFDKRMGTDISTVRHFDKCKGRDTSKGGLQFERKTCCLIRSI